MGTSAPHVLDRFRTGLFGFPYIFRSSFFVRSSILRREGLIPFPPRLISKFNIDIAERNGGDFLRVLFSAERRKERAIALALPLEKTPGSKSKASLFSMTFADHLLFLSNFLFSHPIFSLI